MDQPDFPARWKVSDPILIAETFSSRIWKVRLGDGKPAIVKDLKPFDDVEDELRGAHFLAWQNGEGAVRLLGFDGNRMLLEYAGERHLLDDLNTYGDSAATEIAAEAMARLFAPSDRPVPGDLQPLRERFASLFKRAEADRAASEESVYVEAAIASMAEIFARTLGQDVRTILDHATAYGRLSASWHGEDGNEADETRELSIAAAIRNVRANF